ncbi:cell division protein FtsL [Aggregicoccus sp. 17bor-14]|uniref:cell division protein FtsL n=1 Tax=Myxococcaceae TaxID=31 RepID=UPI00129CF7FB|nr:MULTISPECIES: cell division protein FtsL [Myxococcaceae]MBF5044406.1 cell division protein FtsL [Simulacricoccus sp. 17bor-14]MRI90153.1 cell division protein FtsL [Aggregicoccus sp. 17bor-14]
MSKLGKGGRGTGFGASAGTRGSVSVAGVLAHLLPAVAVMVLLTAVGLVHVTGRVMVVDAGYRLSRSEAESRTLQRENDRLKLELATLKTPARLERLAREKLGMGLPATGAVIALAPARTPARVQARSSHAVQVAERSAGQ